MSFAATTADQLLKTITRHLEHATTPPPLEAAALTTALTAPRPRDVALAALLGHPTTAHALAGGEPTSDPDWMLLHITTAQAEPALRLLDALAPTAQHSGPRFADPVLTLTGHTHWAAGRPIIALDTLGGVSPHFRHAQYLRRLISIGFRPL